MSSRASILIVAGLLGLAPLPERLRAQPVVDAGAGEVHQLQEAENLIAEREWDAALKRLDRVLDRDHENLEARYLRGIARREKERAYSNLSAPMADFEFILERDSLYRDVLYQYAMTLGYRNQYPADLTRAVMLAERQVDLKPALPELKRGLLRIYRNYLLYRKASDVRRWLRTQDSDYARYFLGESFRREGIDFQYEKLYVQAAKLKKADEIFARLLDGVPDVPVQVILLSRARIYYALEEPERAQILIEEAIASVEDRSSASFVFDDFKYVVSLDELEQYEQLHSPQEYQDFFRTMWERRDPMPATETNLRLAEHYRRVLKTERYYPYLGFRAWYNESVDQISERGFLDKDYPLTHALAAEYDDRGIILLRHGEPHDREISVGPGETAESWQYNDPDRDFHFATGDGGKGVGNYRLRPTPHAKVLEKVLIWDGRYMALAKARGVIDRREIEDRILERTRRYLAEGLTTDQHSWPDAVEPLDMPYVVAAFRGEGSRAELEIHYALPLGRLSESSNGEADPIELEVGVAVHDTSWRSLGSLTEVKRYLPTPDASAAAVDLFRLSVAPDSYHVAIHARSLEQPQVGGHKLDYRVPDFSAPTLAMSGVLPAFRISPSSQASTFNRGDLHLEVNPFSRFSRMQPLFVYFEIYHLTLGEDDRTNYTVEYRLRSRESQRLFGGDEGIALSIQAASEGTEPSPVEYAEIDVNSVPEGDYTLTVRVTDKHTDVAVEHDLQIEIAE